MTVRAPSTRRRPSAAVLPLLVLQTALLPFAAPGAAAEPLRWEDVKVPGSGGRMTHIVESPHDEARLLVLGDMLGIGLSRDGGASWGMSGFGLPSHEMGTATWHPTDPDVVWAGSMSGPAVSEDGGLVFALRRDGMGAIDDYAYSSPIEAVLFDPNVPDRLLAHGGSSRGWSEDRENGRPRFGRVWESDDAGRTWRALATLTPSGSVAGDASEEHRLNIVSMIWLGTDLLAAVRDEGVYRSGDGGASWTRAGEGLPHGDVRRVVAHPRDPSVVWAALGSDKPAGATEATPGGIWKSVDGGVSFTPSDAGLTRLPAPEELAASRYEALTVSPHDPDRLVTGDAGWRSGTVFLSEDGGASWRPTARRGSSGDGTSDGVQRFDGTPYRSGLGLESASWSPSVPGRLYAVASSYAVRSDDGGQTFEGLMSERVGGGDFGPRWSGTGFNGLVATDIAFDPSTPGTSIVQGMDTGRVWLTRDGGQSFSYHGDDPEPWGGGRAAAFGGEEPNVYAAFGQEGGFRGIGASADGGRTWRVAHGRAQGLPDKDSPGLPNGIAVDPRDPRRAFASIDGRLYRSDDAGESWNVVLRRPELGTIVVHPRDDTRLIVAGRDALLDVPIDEPSAARPIGGPDGATDIATLPDGTLFATGRRDGKRPGLWRREGADGPWTRVFDDRYARAVTALGEHPERLAVMTDDDPFHDVSAASGPWLSDDGGESWTRVTFGLPVLRGQTIAFDPHDPARLVVGTGGRGWFELRWSLGAPLPDTP